MSDTDFDTLLDDKARPGLSAMTRKACAKPCACS